VAVSGPLNEPARQWYAAHTMPLFTWSSMAGGFMSGRFTPDNVDTFTGYFDQIVTTCYASPENFERLERARRLASDKGLSLPQVALAYVLSYPLDIFALVGSATPEEVQANAQAVNTHLTEEEMAYLDLRRENHPQDE
jgi:aryl-alcohol dehydrogenase-like predicted oxidoreductase